MSKIGEVGGLEKEGVALLATKIKEGLEKRRLVAPVSYDEVRAAMREAFRYAAEGATGRSMERGRGASRLLVPGSSNYAELPGYEGQSPREIIESLEEGSEVLDVGCGQAQLGSEIVATINPGVEVWGFDARKQEGQERLTGMYIGDADLLSSKTCGGRRYDLIISSAFLRHLPDMWGNIGRMSRMLKEGGLMLTSALPRVMFDYGFSAEDARGYLEDPDMAMEADYFWSRGVYDISGRVIPPAEVVKLLNERNPNFRLEYGVAASTVAGAINHGGQISGKQLKGEGGLDLSCMYYGRRPVTATYAESGHETISLILAKTDEEKAALESLGYRGVEDRINPAPDQNP